VCGNNYSFSGFDGGGDDVLPVRHDALQSSLAGGQRVETESGRRSKRRRREGSGDEKGGSRSMRKTHIELEVVHKYYERRRKEMK
jgi:hypothetical protein